MNVIRIWGYNFREEKDLTCFSDEREPKTCLCEKKDESEPCLKDYINNHLDADLEHLDAIIKRAKLKDIRLIVVLTNNWDQPWPLEADDYSDYLGLPNHDDFYRYEEAKKLYKNAIGKIIKRYRDEPRILAWEMINEPACTSAVYKTDPDTGEQIIDPDTGEGVIERGKKGSDDCDIGIIVDWAKDMAKYVQEELKPMQLLSVGAYHDNNHEVSVFLEQTLSSGDIDFGTFHMYPFEFFFPPAWKLDDRASKLFWAESHILEALDIGKKPKILKPVILGEFGKRCSGFDSETGKCTGQQDEEERARIYRDWTKLIYDENGGGFLFWMLGHQDLIENPNENKDNNDGYWLLYPQDCTECTLAPVVDVLDCAARSIRGLKFGFDCEVPKVSQRTVIRQGETRSIDVEVTSDTALGRFQIDWLGSTVSTVLIDPAGRKIDQEIAATDPDVQYDVGPTHESYTISNPRPGVWTMQLYGSDIPEGGEDVTIRLAVDSYDFLFMPIVAR